MAAGLLEANEGHAYVLGRPVGTIEARAATSYLPDAPVLYDDLDVNEHIEYIARLHGTEDWEEYGDDLLEMFNLADRADDLPARLQPRPKQKTGADPRVDPAVQPAADRRALRRLGLARARRRSSRCSRDIAEQGAAVVCSTHQMDLTPKASRCIGLRDGELVYDGPATPEKIRSLVSG